MQVKKRMKKILAIVLSAALLTGLGLTGCSQTEEKEEDGKKSEVTIGIAWPSLGTQAWSAMADYLRWYVEDWNKENDVQIKLIETTAGDDAAAQETQIRDLLNQDVDVVISGAIDTTAIWSSITETHDAGKKFMSFCRRLTPGGPEADSTVGPDTYDTAYVSVDAAIKKMVEDGIAAEDIQVIRVQGDLKDQNAMRYGEGCEAAVEDNGAKIVADIESNWSVETVMNKLAPTLQANEKANLIFTPNEDLMLGVQSVLEGQGQWIKSGEEGHIYLAAAGGCEIGLEMIQSGYLDATGYEDLKAVSENAVENAVKLALGEEPGDSFVKSEAITQENIEPLLSENHFWVYDYVEKTEK
ncbi:MULTISPECIES: sugar ABC transporter substrate-binding protein [Mediterraneibacter]|uniref:sugar ABC transporter substrate-binding protein n=1 Tax=Mediterraneibacter TaxID=2316020 RepID=UPI000E531DF7|nr:substrate-binding domain-containing protein [Mediterraneibacter massiliensis]RGT71040.1 hypothetical protein DWX08_13535 [Ruminococcus sp. AF18-22]